MSDSNLEKQESGPSQVELIKLRSNRLRGTLLDAVASADPRFSESDALLLKFHGAYQQDDRDQRTKRGEERERSWQMMVRLTIPGGVLTSEQYVALDALADRVGNGTLRLTTRQSIQYHGVAKGNLKPLLAAVNDALLTTIAACGDVSRNVMASPAPIDDAIHAEVMAVARGIATELRPQTGAYYEVWLDGERVTDSRDVEPVYGDSYLPRKFKAGVALDTDNSIDIYSYDCGLVAITTEGRITGYNLVVGGGFGITHNKANTFARLGSTIACVEPAYAVAAVRAVCELYRDAGNRFDRRQARLKYLVEQWGAARFTAELQQRVPFTLHPPATVPTPKQYDWLGVHRQGNGKWFFGLFVPNGRLGGSNAQLRTVVRDVVRALQCNVRITPMQSLLFTDLERDEVDYLQLFFRRHGISLESDLTNVVRYSMACPALPTCGLALADSERALPGVLAQLDDEFRRLGIHDVPLTVRMTGCPNGCARPYNADIGFVGRRPGVYHVYVGGGLSGDRLADLFAADVGVPDIIATLRVLLERYARDRHEGEALGDFYQRALGPRVPRTLLSGREQPTAPLFQ